MGKQFTEIIENIKNKSLKLRRDGQSCCANQVLHVATYLENELKGLQLAKEKSK